jgi:UDP-glucose 4-epimerase
VDIYGHSKLWAEQLVALFHRKTGISAGIARLFNVFGPGETNPHIIPSFILQIQRRTDLRVGDLSTCRDYIFVDDVCSGLAALAQVAPAQGLLTCNLGGEQQYDGSAIVKAIGDLVGHTPILQVEPRRLRPADRPYLVSDCTRAHDVLGWRAQTDLSAGLSAAIRQPIAPSLDPASIA